MIHSKFRFKWFVFKYIYNPRLLLYFLSFTKLDLFDLCSSGAHGLWRSVVWPDHRYVPNWNVSTTFGWLVIQSFTEIHGLQRMNPTDGSKPLTYHLTPPASRCFHLSGESSTSVRNLAKLGKYTMVANSQCSATMCLIFGSDPKKLGTDIHVLPNMNCKNLLSSSGYWNPSSSFRSVTISLGCV